MFASLWNRKTFRTSGVTTIIEDDLPSPNSLRESIKGSVGRRTARRFSLLSEPMEVLDSHGKPLFVESYYDSYSSYRHDLLYMCRTLGVDTLEIGDYLDGYDDAWKTPEVGTKTGPDA